MTGVIQSPYLPGTNIQFAFDSTSLGYLKTCPRLYKYIMIDGWSSREDSVHLRFGIEYHAALQNYDLSRATGISHEDAVHDTIRELFTSSANFESDHKTKNRASLVRTVIWYLDKFRDDVATTFIFSDGKPAVEQSFRFELEWGPRSQPNVTATQIEEAITNDKVLGQRYVLSGHLDRVVTYNDDLFVMDRKTTSYAPTEWYFSKYEPDNQMSLYSLASRVVFNAPVRGVIIDAAQIKEDETIFGRGFTYRTLDQISEWFDDLHFWFALAEEYAVADYWPMNDTACDRFGGCRFRSICSKSPSVRERFLEANFVQLPPESRWNPLKPR